MKNKKKLIGLAALALAATTVAACSSSSSTTAGDASAGSSSTSTGNTSSTTSGGAVNVLVVADQSGPNKTIGTQEALGVQAGAAYLNAHGGVLGHQVSVTILNDDGDPATATSLVVKTLAQNPTKYSMIYPGEEGTIIAALTPIVKRDSLYAVGVNDGSSGCLDASNCPTQFSLTGAANLTTIAPVGFFSSKKYTNVGVLSAQLDFTQNEATDIQPLLTKAGIKFETASFPISAVSVTSEMSQLKSGGAQAVYAAAFGAPIGYILQARAQLGWNVPVVFDVAGASFDIPSLAPASEMSGVYETAFKCMDPSSNLAAIPLIKKYAPTAQDPTVPCNQVASGWDSMMIFSAAAKSAGSLSSTALAKATEGINLANSTATPLADYGKYCYTATNHENACQSGSDFVVVPVGKIQNSVLSPLS
jgi:branched-chain amino acid transport system substrate-binding protein